MSRKQMLIGAMGALFVALTGCASTSGLDPSNLSYECQQQAQVAANQPPFPDKIRNGKRGQEFEQGTRDARMTQSCQHDVQARHEISFGRTSGT